MSDDEEDWELAEEDNYTNHNSIDSSTNLESTAHSLRISVGDTLISTDNKTTQKKKVAKVSFTTEDCETALDRHQENLMLQISRIQKTCQWTNNEELAACVLSIVPHNLSLPPSLASLEARQWIRELCVWFSNAFKVVSNDSLTEEEGRDGSDPHDLVNLVMSNRVCSASQLNQIFISLLTLLSLEVRLVCTLDPVSFSPYDHADLYHLRLEEKGLETLSSNSIKKSTRSEVIPISWAEVLLPSRVAIDPENFLDLSVEKDTEDGMSVVTSPHKEKITPTQTTVTKKWVPINIVAGHFDQSTLVEKELRHGKPIEYAIAIDSKSGVLKDVSPRYSHVYKRQSKKYLSTKKSVQFWLESYLEMLNSTSASYSRLKSLYSGNTKEVIDLSVDDDFTIVTSRNKRRKLEQRESIELKRLIEDKEYPLPSSLSGFKDHPKYLLERHLLTDEALNPNNSSVVACFKGENIYLQEHKEKLLSRIHWRRKLRSVKSNENPSKTVKRRKMKESAGNNSSDNGVDSVEIKLYGSWQTEDLKVMLFKPVHHSQ